MSDNPSAFPFNERHPDGTHYWSNAGMSLRDWFAGQALAGLCASDAGGYVKPPKQASDAYEMADAMLAERAKRP